MPLLNADIRTLGALPLPHSPGTRPCIQNFVLAREMAHKLAAHDHLEFVRCVGSVVREQAAGTPSEVKLHNCSELLPLEPLTCGVALPR